MRLSDAHVLFEAINAVDQGLLDEKRNQFDAEIAECREVLP
jgi:hypothetical protein